MSSRNLRWKRMKPTRLIQPLQPSRMMPILLVDSAERTEDAVYDEVQIGEDLIMERNDAYETNAAAIPAARNTAYFTIRVDSAGGTGDVVTDGEPQREGLEEEYVEPEQPVVYDYVFI